MTTMETFEQTNGDALRGTEIVDAVLAHRYARAIVREINRDKTESHHLVALGGEGRATSGGPS
jgi:hypothetical protein